VNYQIESRSSQFPIFHRQKIHHPNSILSLSKPSSCTKDGGVDKTKKTPTTIRWKGGACFPIQQPIKRHRQPSLPAKTLIFKVGLGIWFNPSTQPTQTPPKITSLEI
jgi:hypothetical protein